MNKSSNNIIQSAVFDISSNSVAGAHILIQKNSSNNKNISVLANSRIYSQLKEGIDIERYVNTVIEQLTKTINILKKADNHKPEYIQVLLASPWFVSQSRIISYNKNSPFTCTKKLIDSLVDKEMAFIIENGISKFEDIGKDSIIIEKQISQIRLNGYTTTKPFGKKIKSLELFLIVTISPKFIIDKFKDEFIKNYASATVKFTTSPYATFITSRDFLNAENEIMLIDIGEEATDIACVKDDLFLYQHSFPLGIYKLYRELIKDGQNNISETRALIESFRLNKLSGPINNNIKKAIDSFGESWKRSFAELIDSEKNNIKIPESFYISCDSKFGTFFEDILKQDIFIKHATGSTNIKPIIITNEILSSHFSSLDSEEIDTTLLIGGLFASRIL